jgi:hypothetical protein
MLIDFFSKMVATFNTEDHLNDDFVMNTNIYDFQFSKKIGEIFETIFSPRFDKNYSKFLIVF